MHSPFHQPCGEIVRQFRWSSIHPLVLAWRWCLRGDIFFKFRKQRFEFQLAFGGGVIDVFTPKVRPDSSNAPTEAPDIAQKLLQDPATFLLVFGTHEVNVWIPTKFVHKVHWIIKPGKWCGVDDLDISRHRVEWFVGCHIIMTDLWYRLPWSAGDSQYARKHRVLWVLTHLGQKRQISVKQKPNDSAIN